MLGMAITYRVLGSHLGWSRMLEVSTFTVAINHNLDNWILFFLIIIILLFKKTLLIN